MTGWAVLGTGTVSSRWAAGLRTLGQSEHIVAVASRDPVRAARFASRHGGSPATYEDAVKTPGVEAVYIATPPPLHEEHALLAIAAGKAVLVEKPFAIDGASGRRIVSAARSTGVFCMEAMWTRFLPMVTRTKELLSRGTLGEVRSMSANFMISDAPNPSRSVFRPDLGGGALLHRGVYPVSLARYLLGPASVVGSDLQIGTTGVDEECTLILRHDSGSASVLRASLRATGRNSVQVSGTHAVLELDPPCFRPSRAVLIRVAPREAKDGGLRGKLQDNNLFNALWQRAPHRLKEKGRTIRRPYAGNGYHYQTAEVSRLLALGASESPIMPLDESLEILTLLDDARLAGAQTSEIK